MAYNYPDMPNAAKRRKPKPTLLSLAAEVRSLKRDFTELRKRFKASQLALAAAQFRALNERQATEGVARVGADLRALRERGIIDEKGNRTSPTLPKAMTDTEADVV